MGFSSISFLFYFLPPFFLVYYLVPRRLKNIVALLGSLAFYAWGEPTCFLLIAAATLANYGLGLWMRRARRLALAFGLTLDLGLLFLFKRYLGQTGEEGWSILLKQIGLSMLACPPVYLAAWAIGKVGK